MTNEVEVRAPRPVAFRLFGAVEMRCDGQLVDLSTREQCLLAALLLANGGSVAREALPDWIWDRVPETASAGLDSAMTNLRAKLTAAGLRKALITKDRRCELAVPAETIDVHRFAELLAAARSADDPTASRLLSEALELSRGEPMAGLYRIPINNRRAALMEERLGAELRYAEVEIRQGRAAERVPDLAGIFAERADDSRVAGLTMLALHLTGRRPEALAVYDEHRRRLDDIGLGVSPETRELQMRVLNDDEGARVVGDAQPPPRSDTKAGRTGSGRTGDSAEPRRAPRVNIQQNADVINHFAGQVIAPNSHFGPRYDRAAE